MTEPTPDSQARAVLAWLARRAPDSDPGDDDALWLADFRARTTLLHDLGGDPPALHRVHHQCVGALPMRLYDPAPGPLPVLFHIHGGGAIAGSVDGHDTALRRLAADTGWRVAAPAYRRAPEARFPAMLDDLHAALLMLAARADIDPGRILLSGDSIGATLATTLARRLRDAGGPRIAGQLLLYPNTDLRRAADWPSRRAQDGNIIDAAGLERQIDLYLATPGQRHDPDASPILATDLAGLPPTLLVTCGCDPLRDEGEAYGRRLADAGVAVTHHRLAGTLHAVLQMGGHLDATTTLVRHVTAWLNRHFPGPAPSPGTARSATRHDRTA